MDTYEAELLKIDQQLETVHHSSKPNGPPSKPNSRHDDHDEPSRPKLAQEDEAKEDWQRQFYEMDLYNDELLLENSKLADKLIAAK